MAQYSLQPGLVAVLCLIAQCAGDLLFHETFNRHSNEAKTAMMRTHLYNNSDVDPLWQTREEVLEFYKSISEHFEAAEPTVNSMMVEGDWQSSLPDIEMSVTFLADMFPEKSRFRRRGLDLGAGNGRSAKGVLLRFVRECDLVDQSQKNVAQARTNLGPVRRGSAASLNGKGAYMQSTVQDFVPQNEVYDIVSLQYLASSLTDADLVSVLLRHKKALKPNGLIFLKDSTLKDESLTVAQKSDGRIIRPSELYRNIFAKAGLHVVKQHTHVLPPVEETNYVTMFLVGPHPGFFLETDAGEKVPIMGVDSDSGEHFYSLEGMWQQETNRKKWHQHVKEYWAGREANVNNPEIAGIDLKESGEFLHDLFPPGQRFKRRGLDLGSGVGRVAQGVLLKYVYTVDLVDQGAHFLREAKNRLNPINLKGQYVEAAVQDVEIPEANYDLVCLQYTALYLSDEDLLRTLKRVAIGLKEGGILFFKENLPLDPKRFQVNRDSAFNIFRMEIHYLYLFQEAGLKVVKKDFQKVWIEGGNPIVMFALQPISYTKPAEETQSEEQAEL